MKSSLEAAKLESVVVVAAGWEVESLSSLSSSEEPIEDASLSLSPSIASSPLPPAPPAPPAAAAAASAVVARAGLISRDISSALTSLPAPSPSLSLFLSVFLFLFEERREEREDDDDDPKMPKLDAWPRKYPARPETMAVATTRERIVGDWRWGGMDGGGLAITSEGGSEWVGG